MVNFQVTFGTSVKMMTLGLFKVLSWATPYSTASLTLMDQVLCSELLRIETVQRLY